MLVTFHTLRALDLEGRRGVTTEELADEIYKRHHNVEAAEDLYCNDTWLLNARLGELRCVENVGGVWYFNPNTRPYSDDMLIDRGIENSLQIMRDMKETKGKRHEGD